MKLNCFRANKSFSCINSNKACHCTVLENRFENYTLHQLCHVQ